MYSTLCDARDVMIKTVQNRRLSIDVRAGMILGLSNDMDKRLNDGRFFTISELLEYAISVKAWRESEEKVNRFKSDKAGLYEYMNRKFRKLFTLEPIGYDWINLYTESEYILYSKGEAYYTEWSEKFDAYMSKKEISFDIQLEQILLYFVFTYFCGAVYDSEILGKGKLCVYSTYYIKELLKAAFIKNGGEISEEEIQDLVLRYSRELEHSEDNLSRIEKF